MKRSQALPFISSATRWKTGVTACGLALATSLMFHPAPVDTAGMITLSGVPLVTLSADFQTP